MKPAHISAQNSALVFKPKVFLLSFAQALFQHTAWSTRKRARRCQPATSVRNISRSTRHKNKPSVHALQNRWTNQGWIFVQHFFRVLWLCVEVFLSSTRSIVNPYHWQQVKVFLITIQGALNVILLSELVFIKDPLQTQAL